MSKVIEFDLPAGALVGKYRHLGGGRFQFDPHGISSSFMQEDTFNMLVQAIVSEGEEFPGLVPARIVDKPEGNERYATGYARLFVGDEDVTDSTNQVSAEAIAAIRDLMGIPDITTSEWMDASVAPSAPGWYLREGEQRVLLSFWDGVEWFFGKVADPAAARWCGKVGGA